MKNWTRKDPKRSMKQHIINNYYFYVIATATKHSTMEIYSYWPFNIILFDTLMHLHTAMEGHTIEIKDEKFEVYFYTEGHTTLPGTMEGNKHLKKQGPSDSYVPITSWKHHNMNMFNNPFSLVCFICLFFMVSLMCSFIFATFIFSPLITT